MLKGAGTQLDRTELRNRGTQLDRSEPVWPSGKTLGW